MCLESGEIIEMDLKLQINHIYTILGGKIIYLKEIHESIILIAMLSGLFIIISESKIINIGKVVIYDKKNRKPKAEFQIHLREQEIILEFYIENPIENSCFMEFFCITSLGRVFKIYKGSFYF